MGRVSDIISEIAAASKEQTSGIQQVNKAVAEMDKVTQQNAASAEESSSAASELNGQAEELAAMVGTFQLDQAKASRPAAAATQPRPFRQALPSAPRRRSTAGQAAAPAGRTSVEAAFPMEEPGELRDF